VRADVDVVKRGAYAISGDHEMTMTRLARVVQMHKAIGHPVRLRLLSMLRTGPLCVCQMTVVVKLAGSTVSEHLSELRKAGVITDTKDGRWVEYRLAENAAAQQVLAATWNELEGDSHVQADALVLRELRRIPLDELCSVDLDLGRIARPRLAAAVAKAAALRREVRA
jgi:ArsR family transcriptional regulator